MDFDNILGDVIKYPSSIPLLVAHIFPYTTAVAPELPRNCNILTATQTNIYWPTLYIISYVRKIISFQYVCYTTEDLFMFE